MAHPPARFLLATSNGTGMGHLTRQVAVALAAGPRALPTLFSLSIALPVVEQFGLRGEYCPSHDQTWIPGPRWHRYLRERLVALTRETDGGALMFDGVAPYPGLIQARALTPDVPYVWMRRAMWRPGDNTTQLAKGAAFDLILEPGDLAAAADRGATAGRGDAVRIPPVSMLDVIEPLPRAEAAHQLGIDPARPTVLVTLGSGRLGRVDAPGAVVLAALVEQPEWQVCLTRTDIAQHTVTIDDPSRVVELRGIYPLVRYVAAFDAVVSAAGYNAVHEFLPANLPTLLVPNPSTQTDDQVRRADYLAETGRALSAHPEAPEALAAAARRLLDQTVRRDLKEACAAIPSQERSGGAAAAAAHLISLAQGHLTPRVTVRQRYALARTRVRTGIVTALGPRGTAFVKRLLGRPVPEEAGDGDRTVHIVESPALIDSVPAGSVPLLFSEQLDPDVLRRGTRIEHLLPASSDEYRAAREKIIDAFYEVSPPDWRRRAQGEGRRRQRRP